MHRHCLTVLLAGLLVASASGQTAPDPLWVRQFGSPSTDRARAAASDAGGVFITGTTSGNLAAPNAGAADVFLARYTAGGSQAWLRQFGTTGNDIVWAAAVDGAGGVFIGGFMQQNAWLARYDGDGDRIWLRQPLLSYPGAHIRAIVRDEGARLFVAGRTHQANALLARLDNEGEVIWTRTFGTSGVESAAAMATDGAGGVFVTGATSGNLGGPKAGLEDAWLTRYDQDGNQLWLRQWGDPAGAFLANTLVADESGGVFVAGRAFRDVQFLARFDSQGDQLWMTFISGQDLAVTGLALDAEGGVFIGGQRAGEIAWMDAFLGRYDSTGNELWMRRFRTPEQDWGAALAPDFTGGVYLAGDTRGNIAGVVPPPPTNAKIFIARFPSGEADCYANCDGSTSEPILTVDDFTCFINEFAAAQGLPPQQQIEHYANCDGSTTEPILTVDDFTCFINAFAQGCP